MAANDYTVNHGEPQPSVIRTMKKTPVGVRVTFIENWCRVFTSEDIQKMAELDND